MDGDMSNLINQINNMIQNNQIPEDIQNIINNLGSSSKDNENTDNKKDDVSQESCSNPIPDFDIETMMKIKSIMDSMKLQKNDPRANLLRSLKPYLKESRKSKIDQYIQLFSMSKVFETFGPSFTGGENKK